jgi:N-acetylglucosamine-6-sulfatase
VIAAALCLAAAVAWAGERPRVVMLGDSLTAGCDWQARLPEAEVLNLGVSGDSTWSIAARLDDVVTAQPEIIFLQAGINDMGKKPNPEGIVSRHLKIWQTLRERLPEAELHIVSLLPVSAKRYPRWGQPVARTNDLLRAAAKERGLRYIDVYSSLSDAAGSLSKELSYDGLHLRPKAYDPWVAALKPAISRAAEQAAAGESFVVMPIKAETGAAHAAGTIAPRAVQ